MASKRIPLASNPNAVNSPLRSNTAAKRSRAQLGDLRERIQDFDQPPPKKKQVLESAQLGPRRTHAIAVTDRDGRVFESRADHAPLNDFQRRILASRDVRDLRAREQLRLQQFEREQESIRHADKEQIKTWQKHYRRAFPSFVFFFESLPEHAAARASRAIAQLGARKEPFFSIDVTHVVTTRPVPPKLSSSESLQERSSSSRHGDSQAQTNQAKTINPSLLEKQSDAQWKQSQQKNLNGLDLLTQRRPQMQTNENESQRQQGSNKDVLLKARDLGMKTWPLEKFERMLNTLFSLDEEEEERSRPLRKAGSVYTQSKQAPQETDLSQLLRNEKHMPNDRLPCGDITIFRGYFIYVHDAEEKNKPVMTREYTKPQNDDEGEWPHLHSVPTPRCPFIADPVTNKPDDTERDSQAPAENQRAPDAPVTRAASAAVEARLMAKPTTAGLRKRPLELDAPREMAKPNQSGPFHSRNFEPPALKHYSTNTTNTTDTLPPQNRFQFQGMPKPGAGREPLASGLQQSNQTSAIQSQMISSTAANPGSRRPQTKEMHDLQRRAFVQRRGMSANTNDLRAAINNPPSHQGGAASRQTRLTTLSKIHENETQSDGEEDGSGKQPLATAKRSPKKKAAQRDMKPGYCENCRDKYEDFTEHIASRKHRKFALTTENWTDLDHLLKQLARK